MKKALVIASVASMLDNFNQSNIDILQKLGYEVTLAANFYTKEDSNSQEKINSFVKKMQTQSVRIVQIDFTRNLKKAGIQMKSVLQVRKLLKKRFALIHCHSPICSAIVRAEAQKYRRKYGTRVIYTAHGFHFFKGAPIQNWIVFYPVERFLSRFTDVLITINQEDYKRASKKFKAQRVAYIPGVGVDTNRFQKARKKRQEKRRELGISTDDIVLLSVGELNRNKNQELAIRALAVIRDHGQDMDHIKYMICGIGKLESYLKKLISELGLKNNIRLLGFREDMADIYGAADIFLFMSKREGLPMSLMEAMSSGLPSIVTNVRGNIDLIRNNIDGYVVEKDKNDVANAINKCISIDIRKKMSKKAIDHIRAYDKKIVENKMRLIYRQS